MDENGPTVYNEQLKKRYKAISLVVIVSDSGSREQF